MEALAATDANHHLAHAELTAHVASVLVNIANLKALSAPLIASHASLKHSEAIPFIAACLAILEVIADIAKSFASLQAIVKDTLMTTPAIVVCVVSRAAFLQTMKTRRPLSPRASAHPFFQALQTNI